MNGIKWGVVYIHEIHEDTSLTMILSTELWPHLVEALLSQEMIWHQQ